MPEANEINDRPLGLSSEQLVEMERWRNLIISNTTTNPTTRNTSFGDGFGQITPTFSEPTTSISPEMFASLRNEPIIERPRRNPLDFLDEEYYEDGEEVSDTKLEWKTETKDPDRLIMTADGNEHKASECVYLSSRHKYYHKQDPRVKKDYFTEEFLYENDCCIFNTKFEIKDGKVFRERGYTHSNNVYKLIPIWSCKYNFEELVLSLDVVTGWDYKESYEFGKYVDLDYKDNKVESVKHYENYKNNLEGLSKFDPVLATKIGRKSPSYTITEGLRYTFGVELETSRGYLPKWLAHQKYNVLCVRDGSINGGEGGGEYVTGILSGDTGFNHLQEICMELTKRTRVNASCGMHVHLGNIDFTKEFLINSYRLALLLETEVFSTLPKSRRNNTYCKKLKKFKFSPAIVGYDLFKIEEDYNKLFSYISVEKVSNPTFEYNKSKQHPLGAKCSYNHETPRYCWLNYVPAMFNTRLNGSYSLEIRNASGTTSFKKVKNWTLFFMGFCAFSERYPELIVEGITIADVINKIFPKKAESLNSYFKSRKELFNEELEDRDNDEESKKTMKELISN